MTETTTTTVVLEAKQLTVREAERLHHRQFVGALADGLSHGVGHMRDAKDVGIAHLGEGIERRGLHLDRKNAALFGIVDGLGGLAERRIGGPGRTDDGPQAGGLERTVGQRHQCGRGLAIL